MAHPLQQPQHDIILYVHTYNGGGSSGGQIKCTHAQRGPCALSPVLGSGGGGDGVVVQAEEGGMPGGRLT